MASLIFSIIGAIIGLIGLVPLLGILNWVAILVLIIALICGIVGIKKSTAKAGLIISIIFLAIAIIRLVAGGGVI